jgi:hypothetical protein
MPARRGTPTSVADTSSAATRNISVPAGVVDGDLLICVINVNNASGSAPVPTVTLNGWTQALSIPFSTYSALEVWIREVASEPASYSIATSPNSKGVAIMMAYSDADTTDPFGTAKAGAAETTAKTAHTTPAITPRNASDWGLSFFVDRSTTSSKKNTGWTPTAPASERLEANNNTAGSAAWVNLEVNDTNGQIGSTNAVTYTSTSSISQANAAMAALALRAPQSAPPPSSDNFFGFL